MDEVEAECFSIGSHIVHIALERLVEHPASQLPPRVEVRQSPSFGRDGTEGHRSGIVVRLIGLQRGAAQSGEAVLGGRGSKQFALRMLKTNELALTGCLQQT